MKKLLGIIVFIFFGAIQVLPSIWNLGNVILANTKILMKLQD